MSKLISYALASALVATSAPSFAQPEETETPARRRDMRDKGDDRRDGAERRRDLREKDDPRRRDMRKRGDGDRARVREKRLVEPRPSTVQPGPGKRPVRRPGAIGPRPMAVSSMRPDAGPPGTEITILGRGFGDDVTVLFDGDPVPAKVARGRITFEVPKRRGVATVSLRVPGAGNVLVGRFDIDRKPAAAGELARRRDERRKRAEQAWKARRKEIIAVKLEERRRADEERRAELERTRLERQRQRREELRARWEVAFLANSDVRAEMALHAERQARLTRMKELAELEDLGNLVIRIDVLMAREDERHEGRMTLLKETFAK